MLSPIPNTMLSNILQQYPLLNARVLNILRSGKRNDSFLIEDASKHRYVLRHYRRNNQESRVRFQLCFQEHLENLGFPTSKIVRTVSDDSLTILEGTPWVLFTFIEGTEYDFNQEKQAPETARRLAQFHTLADSFKCPEVVIDFNHMPDWWRDGEHEVYKLEEFFKGMGMEKELACVQEYMTELINEWPLERNRVLQLTWEHGDYHGRNMVFIHNEMRGLFDFDVVHRGPRIEDIARSLFMFGRENWDSNTIRTNIAQAFLEEYLRNTTLSPEEIEAIPLFAVFDCIPIASYYTMLQRDGEDPISYLHSHVETMCKIRLEMKRIEPIFRL